MVRDTAGGDSGFAWSSDGERIAFVNQPGGAIFEIFVIDAAGGDPMHITDDDATARDPAWRPRP